jgi:hypothetical protein
MGTTFSKDAIKEYDDKGVGDFLKSINYVFDKKLKEDIPEMKVRRVVKPVYLEIHPLQKILYQKIVEREIHKLEQEYDKITWKLILNKMHLLCYVLDNPFLIKDIADDDINKLLKGWSLNKDPKFIALKSLINNYADHQGEKVAVFGISPGTLDMLHKEFSKYKPLIIHGSLKVKDKELDRSQKEDRFNNSDENKIIFLSALTSSQGINLNKKCRRIVVYESPDAQRFRQLMDRTHRINSTMDTILEILVMDRTLDNIRVNRNLNKVKFNDKMGKEITQDELSRLLRGII